MQEIGYSSWAFIPTDPDPTTGEVTTFNPPMLTTVVLDPQTSLVFQFSSPPGSMQITLEATAMSAEERGPDLFRTFTGSANGAFHELTHPDWATSLEGMYTSFSTQLTGVDSYLKLLFDTPPPIVINRISFAKP